MPKTLWSVAEPPAFEKTYYQGQQVVIIQKISDHKAEIVTKNK